MKINKNSEAKKTWWRKNKGTPKAKKVLSYLVDNKGKKFSEEHKKKISDSGKRYYSKKENKERYMKETLPKIMTKERNRKISEKMKGRKFTEEHKKKLSGKNHYNWKGKGVGYKGLHQWLRKHKPRPKLCEDCNDKPSAEIANISGSYTRNIKDYKWLCVSCHHKRDKLGLNFHRRLKRRVP